MSKTITIKIDKRPVTLTAKDVAVLVKIARDIDRSASYIAQFRDPGTFFRGTRIERQRLAKWLDTHGPDATNGGVQ